jgi:hypothetical protein
MTTEVGVTDRLHAPWTGRLTRRNRSYGKQDDADDIGNQA